MDALKVTISPSSKWTRVLVTHGDDEILKANLPPPWLTPRPRAAAAFLESLSLWFDATIPVVLCVTTRRSAAPLA